MRRLSQVKKRYDVTRISTDHDAADGDQEGIPGATDARRFYGRPRYPIV